ncbi:MAG: tetratricopeptide repeat protein [Planctomycetota bacterium]|nr:tetratricopeptide repeat protein [Planctomycetota bacterium]
MNKLLLLTVLSLLMLPFASAGHHNTGFSPLDLERYKQLREAERYQIDLADKQFQASQWDAAINEYNKFLKLYPDSNSCSYAQMMMAYCHEGKKYVNEAMKQYQKVLDYYPKSLEGPHALYRMSQCNLKSGEFADEIKILMQIISDKTYAGHPVVPVVLYRLAGIADADPKQIEQSVKYRKQIVTDYQGYDYFRHCVSWLASHYLLSENDPVSARNMFIKYPGQSNETVELWVADTYLAAARSNKDKSDEYRAKARTIWEEFPAKFPNATSYSKQCTMRLAQSYRDAGDHKKALEIYAAYIAQYPNDDGARFEVARYLEEQKRWNDGRMEYLKMEDKLRAQWEIAYSYERQGGKSDEAISNYQTVIDSDFVRYADAMYRMGEVLYYQKNDYETALKRFMESNYSPPTHLFRVADCLKALKRFDPAIKQYGEIVTFFKGSASEAYLRMGRVYLDNLKQNKAAIEVFQTLIRNFPKSGQASQAHRILEDLGVVLTGGGLKEEK